MLSSTEESQMTSSRRLMQSNNMIKLPQIVDMRKKSYEPTANHQEIRKMSKIQPGIKQALIPKKKPIF